MNSEYIFNNNEGIGGFEQGAYDKNARFPIESNWTRLSRYQIPKNPKLLWKASVQDAFIDNTSVNGGFVIDRNKDVILAYRNGSENDKSSGKIVRIDQKGNIHEIYTSDQWLKAPILGENGLIYICTTGFADSVGHRLLCIEPNGSVNWNANIRDLPKSRPVIDRHGNVYIFTAGHGIGTLHNIHKSGAVNWELEFTRSVSHYLTITADDIILLDLPDKLCALTKDGKEIWKQQLDYSGESPIVVKNDGTIYIDYDSELYALDRGGQVHWRYKPEVGNVFSSPAISANGDLYLNLGFPRLACLNSSGKQMWVTETKAYPNLPPIIGSCNTLIQQSYMHNYPRDISWIEAFTSSGAKIWEYELKGTVVSTALADDNLLYVLVNVHTRRQSIHYKSSDEKWELYAIGSK